MLSGCFGSLADLFTNSSLMSGSEGKADVQVPTLVPKPASPTVTQEHLPGRKSAAKRSIASPWVTLSFEICSLKIRVSVVD